MFWIPLAAMAAGTLTGKEKQAQQQRVQNMQTKMRSAEQRYSPWTGRQSFTQVTPAGSQAGEMLSGGLAGLGTGMSMMGAFGGGASKTLPTNVAVPGQTDEFGVNQQAMQAAPKASIIQPRMPSPVQFQPNTAVYRRPSMYARFGNLA